MNPTLELFMPGVHGFAVGTGIANAIFAVADEPMGTEAWIHFCVTAAEEAAAEVLRNPPLDTTPKGTAEQMYDTFLERNGKQPVGTTHLEGRELEQAAQAAGSAAFMCCLPPLTGRRNIQAYIGCITAGMQRRWIDGRDGSKLLYPCQLALSAYPKRKPSKGGK